MDPRRWALVSLAVALLIQASAVGAQPAALAFERLSLDDGLTGYGITALAHDASGFLWIGTKRGLNRYDGVRVRAFTRNPDDDRQLRDDHITALVEDPHHPGALWVGTRLGGLSRFDPQTELFTSFTAATSALPSNWIQALHADRQGTLWVGTDAGLYRFSAAAESSEAFQRVTLPGTLTRTDVRVIYEAPSRPGQLWIGTAQGLALLNTSGEAFPGDARRPSFSTLDDSTITALAEADGALWCGTETGTLYRIDLATRHVARYPLEIDDTQRRITALRASDLFEDILWIGTYQQGLLALDTRTGTTQAYTRDEQIPQSLSDANVNGIVETDERLWVGTEAGLNASHPPPLFSAVMTSGPVLSLYEAPSMPGTVWVSVSAGGLWTYDRTTGTLDSLKIAPAIPNRIIDLHEDRLGQFWLAGDRPALFLLDRSRQHATAYPLRDGDLLVHQIYESPTHPGFLWLATREGGLLKFDIVSKKVVHRYTASPDTSCSASAVSRTTGSLCVNYVFSLHERPEAPGIFWLGTRGGGLHRLDTRTHTVTVFRRDAETGCLPSDDIISVASTPDGMLWLGTYGAGLVGFDPHTYTCTTFTRTDGLPHSDVGTIFVDSNHRLWLGTSNGLSVFDPAEETFTTFTREDGLQSNVFHYDAEFQHKNGEIIVGGKSGFTIFHPNSIIVASPPPRVVITGLRVDGQPFPLDRRGEGFAPLTLDYTQRDLAFDFAALDLRQPSKNRYKVRLDGADDAWQPLGNQTSVRYPLLTPGRYTFRVAGANSEGVWNEDGAALTFRIRPPFWRAWWFWALLAGATIVLLAVAYQYRVRQLLRVERTRQRIADDLHDDIGSKISNVALRLDLAGRTLALRDDDQQLLADLSHTARAVVDDLRDAVWIVDAGHDTLSSLVARMEQSADEMLRGCTFTFAVPTTIPDAALPMERRRHLYLFFKEALHNVVRHSQADQVTIALTIDAGLLDLRVVDDGIGFDVQAARRGRGLRTMRTRADALDGDLHLASEPGQGTTVRLQVQIV